MLLVVLLYIICASMFTISKWGLAFAEPFFFMAVRMIGAGLLLGLYALFTERATFNFRKFREDASLFLQAILFHIFFTYIFDLYALKSITSIESAFLYNFSPFIAAFFSYWMFREYMTWRKWLGLSIGFVGLLPELFQGATGHSESLIPKLLTLAAVIASSYGWVVVRALVKKGYSPIVINSVSMIFGGLLALIPSYYYEVWNPVPVTQWMPFIQAVMLVIVVSNLIFYNLYGYLLKRYTATFLSFAGLTCPLFTAIFGRLFLNETFSWELVISFGFICIGLAIFYSEELKQGYVQT